MLILSRYEDESIECTIDLSLYMNSESFNPKIPMKIHVREINGNRVSIGIEAPDSVKILRSELLQE